MSSKNVFALPLGIYRRADELARKTKESFEVVDRSPELSKEMKSTWRNLSPNFEYFNGILMETLTYGALAYAVYEAIQKDYASGIAAALIGLATRSLVRRSLDDSLRSINLVLQQKPIRNYSSRYLR